MWLTGLSDKHRVMKSTCVNRSESVPSWRERLPLRNIHDLRLTCGLACWVLMYQVTMETADICSEHRPEEQVTPTSARTQMCVHRHTTAYIHIHPEGKQDRKLSGEIRVNILFLLWDFNSKISLWRFKYIKSYPLKTRLIYSLLYSHQPLCLLFISALLMFIFIAISDTSVSVLFQSVNKVKFSPSKPSFFSQTPPHLSFLVLYSFYCPQFCIIYKNKSSCMSTHTKKFSKTTTNVW